MNFCREMNFIRGAESSGKKQGPKSEASTTLRVDGVTEKCINHGWTRATLSCIQESREEMPVVTLCQQGHGDGSFASAGIAEFSLA